VVAVVFCYSPHRLGSGDKPEELGSIAEGIITFGRLRQLGNHLKRGLSFVSGVAEQHAPTSHGGGKSKI
jgi:hypothetical protein